MADHNHRNPQAEVKPRFAQLANFEREHLEIPAGVERQLVVGEHIGAALRRREVRQDDARHLVEAEQMRGAHRPAPAIMPSSSSISTGLVKPNSRIEAAICATCWSLCLRALLAYGISAAHRRRTIISGNVTGTRTSVFIKIKIKNI